MRLLHSIAVLALLIAPPAFAADGVLEINQACAATGCFPGDSPGLPVSIGVAGSYRLTSSLAISDANTHGIEVVADGVSIDLAGFEIRGPLTCSGTPLTCSPSSGTGIGVQGHASGFVSVSNGTIRGMGRDGVSVGQQGAVSDLRLISNGRTGVLAERYCEVTGNLVSLNGLSGIVTSEGCTVTDNTVDGNASTGVDAGIGSTVSRNTSIRNGGSGFTVGPGSSISGNTAYGNGSAGIVSFSGCTLIGNTVRLNTGPGLLLGEETGYAHNVISSNAGGTVSGSGLVALGNNACNGSPVCP